MLRRTVCCCQVTKPIDKRGTNGYTDVKESRDTGVVCVRVGAGEGRDVWIVEIVDDGELDLCGEGVPGAVRGEHGDGERRWMAGVIYGRVTTSTDER